MWLSTLFIVASLTCGIYGQKEHVTCDRSEEFQKIGCFHTRVGSTDREDAGDMKMLLTDRDKNSPYYSGYLLNWREFDKSTHSLACRCAQAARKEGLTYISIRFWGECYGGKDFNALTPSLTSAKWRSTKCKNPKFGVCDDKHTDECVGEAAADYIYKVGKGNSAAEKVDGGLTGWSEWTNCPATCGTESIAERERTCTNPLPSGGGAACEGELTETKACATVECPVDGGLTAWGPYGVCSLTCGGGVAKRTRSCTNPPPAYGGKGCSGHLEESSTCSSAPCPVDGGYGSWSDFGECSATCSDGVKTRSRACNSPSQAHGGNSCDELGDKEETRGCKVKECPIDGRLGSWSMFSPCTASCGGGTHARVRTCNNPPPAHGGKNCAGKTQEVEECGTDPCPIDGGFSAWSSYSKCSKPCGGGSKTQTRSCTKPSPQHGGKECNGPTLQSATCNTQKCPVNGGYGSYGPWSTCSEACGTGSQHRSRQCNSPAPAHGGKGCSGPSSYSQACNTKPCPVNGGYGSYGAWSTCSKVCGTGSQHRSRQCNSPAPAHGGKGCSGPSSNSQVCNTKPCPVNGGWSAFSPYGACTKKCGGGIQIKMKTCTNPAPAYGGRGCSGSNTMIKVCNTASCAVHGGYGSWSGYGACSKSCGVGYRSRSRLCNNPAPAHGGLSCLRFGAASSQIICNTHACPIPWSPQRFQRSCEHRGAMNINCGHGGVIIIDSASYGRRSRSYCGWLFYYSTNCHSGSSHHQVAARCNYRQSCSVNPSNSIFGDPCVRTVKYLEVRYRCKGGPYAG